MQSHFDRGGEDTGPTGGISMETQSRRRHSVETASVSSKSCTISNWASSQCMPVTAKGASRGETRAKDLFIDIEANFSRDEVFLDLSTQRCNLRPSFLPCQAGADASIGAINGGIRNTHRQQVLKDHLFAQVQKGEVCCISSFIV